MDVFKQYYEDHELEEISVYSQLSKESLVIEAEYMHNVLFDLLEYIESGELDLSVIRGKLMDALYESRI